MEIDAKFLILMGIQLHYFLQRPVLQLLQTDKGSLKPGL